MPFINGCVECGTVCLARGGVYELLDTMPECRLQDVERSRNVGLDVRLWRGVGIRDCNQCRQVENHLHSRNASIHEEWITDVARDNIEFPPDLGRREIEIAPVVARVIAYQRANAGPPSHQLLSQMA